MLGRKSKAPKALLTPSQKTIRRTRRVLTGGRWFLIIGLVFYSLMTTTPFVAEHSEWAWSGPALGLIVDAAFIMALSAESTLAKYGMTDLGAWPAGFRWFTGLSSVFLNIWVSVANRDPVGVAVHLIAPALVMLLAEVGPIYMAALARAEATALSAPESLSDVVCELQAEPDVFEPETEPEGALLHKLTGSDPVTARFLPMPETPPLAPLAVELADTLFPEPKPERLPKVEADQIIAEGWKHKLTVKETATAATRHPATVSRRFKELDAQLSA